MTTRTDCANAIRALSMDAVQRANSGHPGAPMGLADCAEVLWNDFLVHNPGNPRWFNRDRFVLSNGHASMLLYSLLHLSGYAVSLEDLKNFRQLHSKTPGHPEFGDTPGVETTTGPLGQGLANAVGMATAEKILAATFNREGFKVVDHFTYAICGDGCLMEGISHEACSLAGTLGLGKLIVLYDDNGISIDGPVEGWFTDNTAGRFRAYEWQVIEQIDGHDPMAVHAALQAARQESDRPSLICVRTLIGKGAPNKAGTESVHGAPLGDSEVQAARAALEWNHPPFEIPAAIYAHWDATKRGAAAERGWTDLVAAYRAGYPALADELERRIQGEIPQGLCEVIDALVDELDAEGKPVATRKASLNTLNAIGPILPELVGGSADLTGSNLTWWSGSAAVTAHRPDGNYVYYGVREFAMAAIMNGIALHGGLRPYGGTFLVFMDYMRNAVRMSALMGQPVIYVFTHDSIGLGEDGPTHQPIEQLTTLRATPGLTTWRPCDAVETAVAWREAVLEQSRPSALVLSRQGLNQQHREASARDQICRGAYVLRDCELFPEVVLIATGSEVDIAVRAWAKLVEQGRRVRVVSMPSCERFDAQEEDYRESVLPPAVRARVAVEAAHEDFWRKYVGLEGKVVGLSEFGASAPAAAVYDHFNLTVERVTDVAIELMT